MGQKKLLKEEFISTSRKRDDELSDRIIAKQKELENGAEEVYQHMKKGPTIEGAALLMAMTSMLHDFKENPEEFLADEE